MNAIVRGRELLSKLQKDSQRMPEMEANLLPVPNWRVLWILHSLPIIFLCFFLFHTSQKRSKLLVLVLLAHIVHTQVEIAMLKMKIKKLEEEAREYLRLMDSFKSAPGVIYHFLKQLCFLLPILCLKYAYRSHCIIAIFLLFFQLF
jgi:hypothetical protein